MRRHKHLKRLERLRDAINKRYGKYKTYEYMKESDFPDGGVWAIWLGLLKDIRECGFSAVFKIDGIRLYYYNELWKKVNDCDHVLENVKIETSEVTYKLILPLVFSTL